MDLNISALQTAPEKRCFPFPTMVYFAVCHRLDDTHAEIDGVNYSMPDFAKRMKHNQISFAPA